MGMLTVLGTLDPSQLWPRGSADADTLRVRLRSNRPFAFRPLPAEPQRTTDVFTGAYMRVKGRKQPVIGSKQDIVVRLQGIDAPELHYRPANSVPELRQLHAESAVMALAETLQTRFGSASVDCEVVTRVDKPGDVFDMYGRFIGDVVVTAGAVPFNINQWLVEQGWALPSFYESMSTDEIVALSELCDAARSERRNLWRRQAYTASIGSLDRTLTYRRPGSPPAADQGRVINPKIFRRLYQWNLAKDLGRSTAKSLREHLLTPKPSNREKFHLVADFLADGAAAKKRDLGMAIATNNRLRHRPDEFVFLEEPSTLFAADGSKASAW